MRVFLYEYTCASGSCTTLHTEGWAMLQAVLEDFGRVPGVQTVTLPRDEENAFRRLAQSADYTLVIAPEFDDLLRTRCLWAVEAGSRLLGPSPEAVALTGDKLALSYHLRHAGIPTPDCWLDPSRLAFPLVWKPRHGAGSLATFLVHSADELARCAATARAEGWHGEAIVQPFVPGQAVSVAFLVGPRQQIALLPAAQKLSADGRFHYRGGRLPLPPPLAGRVVALARRALTTLPGLHGYVGVDLVLGSAADGAHDQVIEINPRLTTSYVGLRALAQTNLAEVWLYVVRGIEVTEPSWRGGGLRFGADGALWHSSGS